MASFQAYGSLVASARDGSRPGSDDAQGSQLFHRLWVGPSSPKPMLSCVKTKMLGLVRKGRKTDGLAHVIGKGQEGGSKGDQPPWTAMH